MPLTSNERSSQKRGDTASFSLSKGGLGGN